MGEPKKADIIEHLNRSKRTTQSKLRKGQPNSTEEVEVGKNTKYKIQNTKYKIGKPGVIVLEEGKLRKAQPNSSEEVKGGEKTKRSSDQPNSHKGKNILDDQLITGKPNSTRNMTGKSRKKR